MVRIDAPALIDVNFHMLFTVLITDPAESGEKTFLETEKDKQCKDRIKNYYTLNLLFSPLSDFGFAQK